MTLSGRRLVWAYGRATPEVPLARLCAAEDGGASESFEVPSLAGAWRFFAGGMVRRYGGTPQPTGGKRP